MNNFKCCNCDCFICLVKVRTKILVRCLNYGTKNCYIENVPIDLTKVQDALKKTVSTRSEVEDLAHYAARYINSPDEEKRHYGYDCVTTYFHNHYYSTSTWNHFVKTINPLLKNWLYMGYEKEVNYKRD